jgi:hypothetical protein
METSDPTEWMAPTDGFEATASMSAFWTSQIVLHGRVPDAPASLPAYQLPHLSVQDLSNLPP